MAPGQGRACRGSRGRHERHHLVALDGSKQAAVAFDIDDVDALTAMLSSMPPEVAAQAESHGVIMPMTVYVEA